MPVYPGAFDLTPLLDPFMAMTTTKRKRLPIGIQTFREIREEDCYYVDKTPFVLRLIEEGQAYFLSRPRRFGKSVLVDTFKELFEGNKTLFTGLYAEDHWDWSVSYPVIQISFAEGVINSRSDLDERFREILLENQERLAVTCRKQSIVGHFSELMTVVHKQFGQRVVVLVDEYDKPILDNITDPVVAKEMRDGLLNLYSVIKESGAHIEFAFLTGVSKFRPANVFSGLNNLINITVDKRYSAICGYTETDLDTVFAPELADLDRRQIHDWYNGYNWTGESVYNPFDLLLLFDSGEFRPYWFETAPPTFLVDLLTERGYFTPNLAGLKAGSELLSTFDVDHIGSEALLFQTGYLTFHKVQELLTGIWVYTLGYPNRAVEGSLNLALLNKMGAGGQKAVPRRLQLLDILQAGDFDALHRHIDSLFASISHDWYRNNPIAQYEGYYASVFYSHFAALGLDITLEDATNRGRIDMALRFNQNIYLFEFKVVELTPEGSALQQLKDKAYADKYRSEGLPIHLIGTEFSQATRSVTHFETETDN
jgi:hypothetical protein